MTRALAVVLAGALTVAGCTVTGDPFGRPIGTGRADAVRPADDASPLPSRSPSAARHGRVETIQELHRDAAGNWLPGTLPGGVPGGAESGQVGKVRGGGATTSAAGVEGSLLDGQSSGRTSQQERAFEVTVRLDDGAHAILRQPDVSELQPGMRVMIENGRARRN